MTSRTPARRARLLPRPPPARLLGASVRDGGGALTRAPHCAARRPSGEGRRDASPQAVYPQGPSLALRPWVVASACPHQQTQPCPLPPDPSGTGRRTAASRSQNSCYPEMCVVLESLFLVSCDLGEKTRWKARGAGRGGGGSGFLAVCAGCCRTSAGSAFCFLFFSLFHLQIRIHSCWNNCQEKSK